jgi:hypothetical protein
MLLGSLSRRRSLWPRWLLEGFDDRVELRSGRGGRRRPRRTFGASRRVSRGRAVLLLDDVRVLRDGDGRLSTMLGNDVLARARRRRGSVRSGSGARRGRGGLLSSSGRRRRGRRLFVHVEVLEVLVSVALEQMVDGLLPRFPERDTVQRGREVSRGFPSPSSSEKNLRRTRSEADPP